MSWTVGVLLIAISQTFSAFTTRNLTVSTINEAAIRSQIHSPWETTRICSDERFRPYFENNLYANAGNFNYQSDAELLFSWKWKEGVGSINDCSGILTYTSSYAFIKDAWTRQRVNSARPMTDLPVSTYDLHLVSGIDAVFEAKFASVLYQLNDEGRLLIDQKRILMQETLGYPPEVQHI